MFAVGKTGGNRVRAQTANAPENNDKAQGTDGGQSEELGSCRDRSWGLAVKVTLLEVNVLRFQEGSQTRLGDKWPPNVGHTAPARQTAADTPTPSPTRLCRGHSERPDLLTSLGQQPRLRAEVGAGARAPSRCQDGRQHGGKERL